MDWNDRRLPNCFFAVEQNRAFATRCLLLAQGRITVENRNVSENGLFNSPGKRASHKVHLIHRLDRLPLKLRHPVGMEEFYSGYLLALVVRTAPLTFVASPGSADRAHESLLLIGELALSLRYRTEAARGFSPENARRTGGEAFTAADTAPRQSGACGT